MRGFGLFLMGIVVGAILAWFYFGNGSKPLNITGNQRPIIVPQKNIHLDSEKIRNELAQTGVVIREKSREIGSEVADASITAVIEGKYVVDPDLSAIQIRVTTEGRVVTLSGTADTPILIARAMELALETPGVEKVVSNLHLIEPTGHLNDPALPRS